MFLALLTDEVDPTTAVEYLVVKLPWVVTP